MGAWWGQNRPLPVSELVFVSAGQGDATLIRHEGLTVLVDVGPRTRFFDGGERLVVPELRRRGVRRVDLLVLTHPDLDHVGGLRALARRFRVGTVVVPAHFKDSEALAREFARARLPLSKVTWLEGMNRVQLGSGTLTMASVPSTEENTGSMVCRFVVGESEALLMGDVGSDVERRMADWKDWGSDVLKLGHHGSDTSTSTEWLEEVRPRFAVASSGRGNPFGHPHHEVVERVERSGARLFRTYRHGSVAFRPTPNGYMPARQYR